MGKNSVHELIELLQEELSKELDEQGRDYGHTSYETKILYEEILDYGLKDNKNRELSMKVEIHEFLGALINASQGEIYVNEIKPPELTTFFVKSFQYRSKKQFGTSVGNFSPYFRTVAECKEYIKKHHEKMIKKYSKMFD